jgi:hypothetical protein
MDDYSNAHNLSQEKAKSKPKEKDKKDKDKKIERVTKGEVVVQKKGLGRKTKDLIIEADFQSVGRYLIIGVLIPALKNTIVSMGTQGIERLVMGENVNRRSRFLGQGPRTTYYGYQTPVQRSSYPPDPGPIGRSAPPITAAARSPRNVREDFICSSREDAEKVLEQMGDILDQYGVVTVQDLNNTVGWPSEYTDNNWGWDFLGDVAIRQVREGFLIDLPPAQHIQ